MKTKYTKDLMAPIIACSHCWADVCRALKGRAISSGSMQQYFKKVVDFHGLDYSHFLGRATSKLYRATPDQVLQLNSGHDRSTVRKIVLENGLIFYSCIICGQGPEWLGNSLTLILDHINGNPKDHRLINLRFVCPNCNEQLPTTAGRKCKGVKKKPHTKRKVRRNSPNYIAGINNEWANHKW